MFTRSVAALAASVALMAAASPASAAVFNLTSIGQNLGTMKNYSANGTTYEWFESAVSDGISFTAIGYSTSTTDLNAVPELARVQRWDGGLGVLNGYEGNGSSGQHTIDNTYRYDFIALQFNKSVQLTGMTLNAYVVDGKGPDKDAWIGYGTQTADMTGAQQFELWKTIASRPLSAKDGAMPNAAAMSGKYGNLWIIGADRTTVTADRNDGFKLGAISAVAAPTASVPEPATWATMMLGFGLAGAAMRRRRTTVAFAA